MPDLFRFCPRCAHPLTRPDQNQERHPQRPPSCQACGFVHWNNPIPVAAMLVEHEGRMVLGRNQAWPKGMLSLFTGFIEPDETPEQCARREIMEEIGLQVTAASLIGHYPFTQQNQLIIAYHVTCVGSVVLSDEIAEVKAIDRSKLKGWNFGTGLAVNDWLRTRK